MSVDASHATEWPDYVVPPPTLDELKRHAAETAEPMETEDHATQLDLLKDSIGHRYADRDDVFIGANLPMYFSALQVKGRDFRAPDLMVVLDAKPDDERPFWVVWNEDGRVPNVVVEILSPSTEHVDRVIKRDLYSRVLGIPEYFIYDVRTGEITGFRLDADKRYAPIAPSESGRVETRQLEGGFGVVREKIRGRERTWMRLFDRDGAVVLRGAEAEAQRAEAEAQRADELAARLAEYERRFGALD